MFNLRAAVNDLYAPLSRVCAGTVRARSLPILEFVHLAVMSGNKLTMTVTDMEITLSDTIELDQVIAGDELLLPAEKFAALLRLLPSDADLEISGDDSSVWLKCGKSCYKLASRPAQDFPLIQRLVPLRSLTLPNDVLGAMLDKVTHAQAKRDVRFYLNGTLFDLQAETLVAVATDGHRLALARHDDLPIDGEAAGCHFQAILPSRAVDQLSRMAALKGADSICLTLRGVDAGSIPTSLEARAGAFTMTTKLIDGKYPDWGRILPESYHGWVELDRAALLRCLQRVHLLANTEYHGIHLEPQFDGTDSYLKVSTVHADGEAEEILPIERDGGLPDRYGVNAQYLIDALGGLDSAKIRLCFRDETSGMELNMPDRQAYREVIMPMRI